MSNKSLKSRLIAVLILACCWPAYFGNGTAMALDPRKELTQYIHDVWQTENGMPQNSVSSIAQTQDGYLWFGTAEGLCRFDGVTFTIFNKRNTPALAHNSVNALTVGRDGSLWIGTGGGLDRFKDGQFIFYNSKNGLASDKVMSIYESLDGTLWVGTAGGALNRMNGEKFVSYQAPGTFPDNVVTSITQDPSGQLWLGTNGAGLHRFNDGKFISYTTVHGMSSGNLRALYADSDGSLWIGTQGKGLNRLKDGKFTAFHTGDGLPSESILSITRDRAQNLWLGTANGIARLRDERFYAHPIAESLSRSVLAIYEDREGSLWAGTSDGGLNRLKDGKFTNYTVKEGLPDNHVRGLYESRDGSVWIGTDGGGLSRLKEGNLTTYTTKDGLSSNYISSVLENRDGGLWIGSTDTGITYFKDGKFTSYSTKDGLTVNRVRTVYESSDGSVWIGSTGAGLDRFKDNKFKHYDLPDGLSHGFVTSVVEARDGSIWIGTWGGLDRFQNGRITDAYTTKNGLSSNMVIAVYEDNDGTIWVGTNGGGLNKFKDGKFSSYTTGQGLYDDVVFQIVEDGGGNFWLTCNTGIFRVSKTELEDFDRGKISSITSVSYGTADGMPSRECNSGQFGALRAKDGKLWFSTIKGATVIDPAKIKTNQLSPPVVIEQILIDKNPIAPSEKLQLQPATRELEFHYTGLSLLVPEKVKFKYKLEGFDKNWVDAESRRIAYYTNLPPGTYSFRVIASNNDGVWNETGATLQFYLKPHFYQTRWFYVLCILVAALLGFCLYRLRVRQLRRRTKQLELIVDQRTQDLQRSQAQVLKLEKQATEQRMAGGFAHEMRNALAGSKLMLDRALALDGPEPQPSLHLANCRTLKEIYLELQTRLSKDDLQLVRDRMQVIFANEEQLSDMLQLIHKATSRGLNITQQIMDYSKVGQQRLGSHGVELQQLITGIINESYEEFSNQGVTLEYEPCQQPVNITGDEDHFYSVIKNPVLNARDALIDPGCADRTDRRIRISTSVEGSNCVISITDNGVGIASENLQKIFEPFFSTKPATGTGLGLGMVKNIVSLYLGTIDVTSKVGQGTDVTIKLPLCWQNQTLNAAA